MVHPFQPSDDFEPGFYEALGRLVTEFGRIENIMKIAVKRLRDEQFDEGVLYTEEQLRHLGPLGNEAKTVFRQRVADPQRLATRNPSHSRRDEIAPTSGAIDTRI